MVDDASPDGTQDIARQLAKVYGEDKIVRRGRNTIRALLSNSVPRSSSLGQGNSASGTWHDCRSRHSGS